MRDSALIEQYLTHASSTYRRDFGKELRATTQETQAARLRMLSARSGLTLEELAHNRTAAQAAAARLRGEVTPLVYRQCVATFAHFAKWAVGDSAALTSEDVPRAAIPHRLNIPSEPEVDRLLAAGVRYSERVGLWLLVLAQAGLRVGETLGLSWSDVVLSGATPHFDVRRTKTDKPRQVPLSPELLAAFSDVQLRLRLRNGQADRRPVAGNRQAGPFAPVPQRTWNHVFKRVARDAGLSDAFTPHSLRHAFCTQLLSKGTPPVIVASLAGHSPQTLLSTYAHVLPLGHAEELAKAFGGVS